MPAQIQSVFAPIKASSLDLNKQYYWSSSLLLTLVDDLRSWREKANNFALFSSRFSSPWTAEQLKLIIFFYSSAWKINRMREHNQDQVQQQRKGEKTINLTTITN